MIGGWLFWIIIGATVLQWVVTKMHEQAALNKAKREREQRRLDSLRTGEGLTIETSMSPKPGPTQGAEIQARRQAQLRALRERQQQRAQRAATTRPPTQPPTSPTGPARRPQRASRPSQFPASAQTPAAPSQAQQARARQLQQQRQTQQRLELERRQEAERTRARARSAPVSQPLNVSQIVRKEAPTTTRAVASGETARPTTREEWRRAIIAAEILAPPVSMRAPE